MSAATRVIAAALVLAASACGGEADEANVVIANEIPPGAEIETLPADESAAAGSEELATGAATDNGI
jgi:hypothetical protein